MLRIFNPEWLESTLNPDWCVHMHSMRIGVQVGSCSLELNTRAYMLERSGPLYPAYRYERWRVKFKSRPDVQRLPIRFETGSKPPTQTGRIGSTRIQCGRNQTGSIRIQCLVWTGLY